MASKSDATRRLLQELNRLPKENYPYIKSLAPVSEDNLLHWNAFILGAEGTPYEGGRWQIDIRVPEAYPLKPPVMKFLTRICHANVDSKSGEICLDLLRDHKWSPVNTLSSTLMVIHQLLSDPNGDSPLNVDAAAVLRNKDHVGYEGLIRAFTVLFAAESE
ncbi:Ubiquitin-conjugating enzyme E2 1 [Rhizina undulata]